MLPDGDRRNLACATLFIVILVGVFVLVLAIRSVDAESVTRPTTGGYRSIQPLQLESGEHLVYAKLFAPGRYKRGVRPLLDHSKSIRVQIGICIFTFDDIIEKDQTMITSGCLKLKWNDELLSWDPNENSNVTWLALPSTDIWLPDIAMVNSPDPHQLTLKNAFAAVESNGDIGYYPSGRFATRCHISLTYFPFDWQECDIEFESWVYPNQWLSIEPLYPEPIDMKDYYINHQWDLNRYAISTGNVTYDGIQFSFVRFRFYFRRKVLYYCVLVIFPCTLMSILQMLSHTIAVEHAARVTLLTALFVSSVFTQGALASQMPKSSDGVTLIQVYLMIFSQNLIISMLITFMNMHVWFRVPIWVAPTTRRMFRAFFLDTGKPPAPAPPASSPSPVVLPTPTARTDIESVKQPDKEDSDKPPLAETIKARLAILAVNESNSSFSTSMSESKDELSSIRPDEPLQLDNIAEEDDQPTAPMIRHAASDVSKLVTKRGRNSRRSSAVSFNFDRNRRRLSSFDIHMKDRRLSSDLAILSPVRDHAEGDEGEDEAEADDGASTIQEEEEETQPQPPPGPPPPTLAERKEKWLQFSMLVDKIFLYLMFTFNILSPVVIFGLAPLVQEYFYDYHELDSEHIVMMKS